MTSTYSELYVNGTLVSRMSTAYGGTNLGTKQFRLGSRFTSANWFNGALNDVRIYDRALSKLEIKEISKGLILHYDFNDPYVEGTTNLAATVTPGKYTGWGSSTPTKISTYEYHWKNTRAGATDGYWDCWGYQLADSYIGKTITFSFKMKNITFTNCRMNTDFGVGQANTGTYPNHIYSSGAGNYNTFHTLTEGMTVYWTGVLQSPGRVLFEAFNVNTAANGSFEFDLYDIQVTVNDHVTPFCGAGAEKG
jgi:hypothetical protein